jgi:FkbM family methyltransferase
MNASLILEALFLSLPSARRHHAPSSRLYPILKRLARREVEKLFADPRERVKNFPPFGALVFPYHKMGAVDSLNLFDLDELVIFSFYWANRARYRRVADIGANLGLHSILLSQSGFDVRAYEPDPRHFDILGRNLALNDCVRVEAVNAAVSSRRGVMEFVRVLGNTTGSHLAGSKENPYGDLERFPVAVEAVEPLIEWADLIKLDAEGHEKEILLATRREHWEKTDALVEVGCAGNAAAIYAHFEKLGARLFAQKINWRQVRDPADMPASYRDGTLFVTCKDEMPWGRTDRSIGLGPAGSGMTA